MIDNALRMKIADWRAAAIAGTLTREQMREALVILRQGRVSASVASEGARRKKAIAAVPDAEDLLKEIEGG